MNEFYARELHKLLTDIGFRSVEVSGDWVRVKMKNGELFELECPSKKTNVLSNS